MPTVGERVRELRLAAGLTQEQLARAADVTMTSLTKLEQGVVTDPSWSTVTKLARALGVSLTDLESERSEGENKQKPARGRPPAPPSTPPAGELEAEEKATKKTRKPKGK